MTNTIETVKNATAAAREAVIVLLLLLFLVFPGAMNNVLTRAGFTTASIAGFQWELQASAQKTREAEDSVAKLEADMRATADRLAAISQQTATPPDVRQQIVSLSTQVEQTSSRTRAVRESLRTNLAAQEDIVRRVAPRRP